MQTSYFSTILKSIPWWYILITLIFSIYHGYRGYAFQYSYAREQKQSGQIDGSYWTEVKLIWVRDLYDALTHFFSSVTGFISWWFLFYIINTTDLSQVSVGFSAIIIFLFIFGFLGITGHIPYIIQIGKFPFTK